MKSKKNEREKTVIDWTSDVLHTQELVDGIVLEFMRLI